jgi:hypothetical protein
MGDCEKHRDAKTPGVCVICLHEEREKAEARVTELEAENKRLKGLVDTYCRGRDELEGALARKRAEADTFIASLHEAGKRIARIYEAAVAYSSILNEPTDFPGPDHGPDSWTKKMEAYEKRKREALNNLLGVVEIAKMDASEEGK